MHRSPTSPVTRLAVIGRGRVGHALTRAFERAGIAVEGPLGRGEQPTADVVLLCVPDAEIAAAAATVTARFVGHTSGATPIAAASGHRAEDGRTLFGLHPLQTITGPEADLTGCGCAIAGSSEEALAIARFLARAAGMEPFAIAEEARAAYHASASIASNFVVTLEWMAERVAAAAGIGPADARGLLAPLVRRTVDNWAELGPRDALTGPVARGDEVTVARQRRAIADAAPDLLPLFDALVDRTRELAA